MTNRIGCAVMRIQPLHRGHTRIINQMIQDCETAIVCLGSTQKSRERHDPWTVEERMQMLRNVYADRIKIVPLTDLNAANPTQWAEYVFDKLKKLGMKEPTDYYTGSEQDSYWYRDHFNVNWQSGNIHDRRLHILNRENNPVPSATEIRGFLELRTDKWREWVPAVNHELVQNTYPEEFKVPLT